MAVIDKRTGATGTTFRARVRVTGYPTQAKTFKRLTDAKLWAKRTEAAIQDGTFRVVAREAKSHTLENVIDRYKNEIVPYKAPSTQSREKTYLSYWSRELGSYALSYLTSEIITRKLNELAGAGDQRLQLEEGQKPEKPKSRKTVKHYRDCLDRLLKNAQKWGWIGVSPMDGVNRITNANKERIRFLDKEERTALLDACKASPNPQLYPVVVFALATGARKSEILNLTLADLNLEGQYAILRETKFAFMKKLLNKVLHVIVQQL